MTVSDIDIDIDIDNYNFDRNTTRPKFDPTRVHTHVLQIMTIHFMLMRRLL